MFPDFIKKEAKRFGLDLDKLDLKKFGFKLPSLATMAAGEPQPAVDSSNSLAKVLVGTPGTLGEYHFPADLIGGCCPRVPGQEEEIVWNAAAEACDTERVHVVWNASGNRIWYLAVRSADLASYPGSWCPFASVLPGLKDAAPPPICYTHFSDESATMMTVTADGLQVHRGMTSVVRAKAERTARELGDAPVVELVPDRIRGLTPVPWYSLSLFEDRARRILATIAILGAITLAGFAFVIWFFATMSLIAHRADMSDMQERAARKTQDLMHMVETMRASPMRQQLAKFAAVNDGLLSLNGLLEVYEIHGHKARWRAIVPANVTADRINEIGGKTIETTAQGVAIGNENEINYEASSAGRKR